jgi:hypothetical protein
MATLRVLLAVLLIGGLSACANKGRIYGGLCHGIYDAASQVQKMKNPEIVPPLRKEPLSYEQYREERQERLRDQHGSSSQ